MAAVLAGALLVVTYRPAPGSAVACRHFEQVQRDLASGDVLALDPNRHPLTVEELRAHLRGVNLEAVHATPAVRAFTDTLWRTVVPSNVTLAGIRDGQFPEYQTATTNLLGACRAAGS